MFQQKLAALEPLRQGLPDGLLDDPRPREPDERPRLRQDVIPQRGEAGGNAAGGRVGEYRNIKPARV
ncbi:hypothetical protein SDC9_210935 [bioreactor metagenome]|uniref:Uncharacterized protein n=1 Tax=bioreactor metagenome TaxID=1076179 RepID=A0A645JJ94_9ZZZZ